MINQILIVAGMIHKSRPIFSAQFHPEAKGGPLDSSYLFDIYLDSVKKYKQNQSVFQPTRETRPSPLLVDLLPKERVGVAPTTGALNVARTPAAPAPVSEQAPAAAVAAA
jgi:carbamoyl-phosphate synthase small subunit